MATSIVVRTDLSGTGFVLDISALELSSNLSTLDFEVTHNGTPSSFYTKTSVSQLTYSGPSVTLSTKIVARRVTSVMQSETTFISTSTAATITNALEKERLRLEEIDARLTYALQQISAGGITLGSIPVNNTAYGAGWDNDTNNAPSKNAVYDYTKLALRLIDYKIVTSTAVTAIPNEAGGGLVYVSSALSVQAGDVVFASVSLTAAATAVNGRVDLGIRVDGAPLGVEMFIIINGINEFGCLNNSATYLVPTTTTANFQLNANTGDAVSKANTNSGTLTLLHFRST